MKQTRIEKADPYLPFYILEKETKPKNKLYWMAVKQDDLDTIDHLVELSSGKREEVRSQKDWEIMEELFNFFAKRWPNEYKDFKDAVPQIRSSRNRGGYSKSKEMVYMGALPPRFERLIKAIFPLQSFNKDFMYKLIKRMPLFKIGGEGN